MIDKMLDIETDAQLDINQHVITISCPNVHGMWQALAEMNCIAKHNNGILHKVNINAIPELMRRREEWWKRYGCLVSIINPILFIDGNGCMNDDKDDELLVYIEGNVVERVKVEMDSLVQEGNQLTLQLNPWEHAFLLHQYDKLLQLCDQHGIVMVLRGLELQCTNVQSISHSLMTSCLVLLQSPLLFPSRTLFVSLIKM